MTQGVEQGPMGRYDELVCAPGRREAPRKGGLLQFRTPVLHGTRTEAELDDLTGMISGEVPSFHCNGQVDIWRFPGPKTLPGCAYFASAKGVAPRLCPGRNKRRLNVWPEQVREGAGADCNSAVPWTGGCVGKRNVDEVFAGGIRQPVWRQGGR